MPAKCNKSFLAYDHEHCEFLDDGDIMTPGRAADMIHQVLTDGTSAESITLYEVKVVEFELVVQITG